MPLDSHAALAAQAAALNARHAGAPASDVLRAAMALGDAALVSSFGADSVVLLHMAAQIDPGIPVLFLETGMLFPETLAYQRRGGGGAGSVVIVRVIRPGTEESVPPRSRGRAARAGPRPLLHLAQGAAPGGGAAGLRRLDHGPQAGAGRRARGVGILRGRRGPHQGEPPRPMDRHRPDVLHGCPSSAAPSDGGPRLPLAGMRALHHQGRAGRGPTRRPLARTREDRVRHPFRRRRLYADRRHRRGGLTHAHHTRRRLPRRGSHPWLRTLGRASGRWSAGGRRPSGHGSGTAPATARRRRGGARRLPVLRRRSRLLGRAAAPPGRLRGPPAGRGAMSSPTNTRWRGGRASTRSRSTRRLPFVNPRTNGGRARTGAPMTISRACAARSPGNPTVEGAAHQPPGRHDPYDRSD